MAKAVLADEVSVLRFFETGPIDKVEVLFNIVSDKMRERLRGREQSGEGPARLAGSSRKRAASGGKSPAGDAADQSSPA
jgi:hypothetical protein